jgi:hypothetical protein
LWRRKIMKIFFKSSNILLSLHLLFFIISRCRKVQLILRLVLFPLTSTIYIFSYYRVGGINCLLSKPVSFQNHFSLDYIHTFTAFLQNSVTSQTTCTRHVPVVVAFYPKPWLNVSWIVIRSCVSYCQFCLTSEPIQWGEFWRRGWPIWREKKIWIVFG